ncbi:ATP-binding protein [Lysobacter korlensis]|uniref:ATP-binding protein n=1 Tax=Lysobacter korlensis TaxID=553636 RepID=A0ABV6RMT3_9GAMM
MTTMTRRISVTVAHDHLLQLVKSPKTGIFELVWNALDADAKRVEISFRRNSTGSLESLVIVDDGTGITEERAESQFEKLGDSWKARAHVSDGGRKLHGERGRGRWAAYGLGTTAVWDSIAERVTGDMRRVRILGDKSDLRTFEVDADQAGADQRSGTTVIVSNPTDAAVKYFESSAPFTDLSIEYAAYIEHYGVAISFDGEEIRPKTLQERSEIVVLTVPEATPPTAQLRIVEWKIDVPRKLYLCDPSGVVLYDMRAGIQAPSFNFTGYLQWENFRDHESLLILEQGAPTPGASH